MMSMIASIVGDPAWGVVAAAVAVFAFLGMYFILVHEPPARTPGPGHPAYEGDEDDDDGV
jgi:hypothetical protein